MGMSRRDSKHLQAVALLEPKLGWRLEPPIRIAPDAPLDVTVSESDADSTWYADYFYGREHMEFVGRSDATGVVSLSVIHGMWRESGERGKGER